MSLSENSTETEFTVRDAQLRDQFSILRLVLSNNLNPLDLDWRRFIVAVDSQNKVIGCGQIRTHSDFDELASLVVESGWQGRGVSRHLIDVLLQESRRPLWLVCESNLLDLYRRFGFEEIQSPSQLPSSFQFTYCSMRLSLGTLLTFRNTYIAYMVYRET